MESADLQGVVIAVLGGDERELTLCRKLARLGAVLRAVGYPEGQLPSGATSHEGAPEAARGADVLLAPMSNTDAKGLIRARLDRGEPIPVDGALFGNVARATPFYIGQAKRIVKLRAADRGMRLIETAKIEEVAVRNAIPTAEGAIQLAMERLPVTLHGARAVVLGFGRCAEALAVRLHALGSQVIVLARNTIQRARAISLNLEAAPLSAWSGLAEQVDVVFNTVPSLVLRREELRALRRGAVVIDIASAPGGTDFEAAEALGAQAVLALGIPGKVAPLTAGKILADTVPVHIARTLSEQSPDPAYSTMGGRKP